MDNLSVNNISHDYGNGRGAFDISFQLKPGEIVGFIGPNGAGKTTTMRTIMGYIASTSGSVSILGQAINSEEDRNKVLTQVGFLPSEPSYYKSFTPRQHFKYVSNLFGVEVQGNKPSSRLQELVKDLDLDIDAKISTLSTGNQRKVGVISALLHSPKLLILDEPTSGLDPVIQKKVLKLFKQVKSSGGSVLLSSHVLSEVEQVCDRIIMIKDGRIIMQDDKEAILEKALKRFRLSGLDDSLLNKLKDANGSIEKIEQLGDETHIYTSDPATVINLLVQAGRFDFYLERPSLEEMFLNLYE